MNREQLETKAWDCETWPDWLHDIVEKTNEVADRLDMSAEQAHAYAVLAALSAPKAEAVTVRPLDLSNVAKHAFLSGVVAARNIPGYEECIGPDLWVDYDPTGNPSYARVEQVLHTSPVPALTDEAVERAAKEMAFAGRMEHDTSEDAEEFWSHTAWGNRTRYRCMARSAILAAFPIKGEGE